MLISTLANILKVKYLGKPIPLYCHWEVTFYCNLECSFCTLTSNENVWTPELDTEKALDTVRQLHDLGAGIIHFVGGEPTLRKDLAEIIALSKKLKIITAITTNGYIKESDINVLKEIDYVRVSLTGKLDEDSMLSPNSKRLNPIKTLKQLVSVGKKPEIATTLSSTTTDTDVNFILNLARDLGIKVGFNFVTVGVSNLNGFTENDVQKRYQELSPLIISQKEAVKKIEGIYSDNQDVVIDIGSYLDMVSQGGLDVAGCRAMDTAICIKANGAVSMPCIEFSLAAETGKIKDIYYGEVATMIREKQGNYWFCKGCTMSCMYSATSLLDIKKNIKSAKRYLMPLVKT